MRSAAAILIFLSAFSLPGCADNRSERVDLSAIAVAPLPADYREQIRGFLEARLVDPDSLKIQWASVHKDFTDRLGARRRYGMQVDFTFNARNRMGGYSGASGAFAFFARGRLRLVRYVNELGGVETVVLEDSASNDSSTAAGVIEK